MATVCELLEWNCTERFSLFSFLSLKMFAHSCCPLAPMLLLFFFSKKTQYSQAGKTNGSNQELIFRAISCLNNQSTWSHLGKRKYLSENSSTIPAFITWKMCESPASQFITPVTSLSLVCLHFKHFLICTFSCLLMCMIFVLFSGIVC